LKLCVCRIIFSGLAVVKALSQNGSTLLSVLVMFVRVSLLAIKSSFVLVISLTFFVLRKDSSKQTLGLGELLMSGAREDDGHEEEKRMVIHLQCPLCAEVLQHHCTGRREIPANLEIAPERVCEHESLVVEVNSIAALEPDEEGIANGYDLNPEFAERFSKTAEKRAARKRERDSE
jgi:hypothetical protein